MSYFFWQNRVQLHKVTWGENSKVMETETETENKKKNGE